MNNVLFLASAGFLTLGILMAMSANKATAYGFTALAATLALVGALAEFA